MQMVLALLPLGIQGGAGNTSPVARGKILATTSGKSQMPLDTPEEGKRSKGILRATLPYGRGDGTTHISEQTCKKHKLSNDNLTFNGAQ